MADFLSGLGKVVNDQFGYGENTRTSLDTEGSDRIGNFGLLGDFAKNFDRSAERTYIEDGLINNIRPRMREVIFMQPDITVLVKKRMFSSLIDNDRLDLLEEKERLLIRASKKLIQNKCKLLSAYERLTKIEQMTVDAGEFNTHLTSAVLDSVAEFERSASTLGAFQFSPEVRSAIDQLRQMMRFSEVNNFTTWVTDYYSAFSGSLGEGTGVIELSTVSQFNSNVSTDFASGSCSFSIEDPYRILHVSNKDIDQAIAEANNTLKNTAIGKMAENELKELIATRENDLSMMRAMRGASAIRFVVSPQSLISKKLRVIMEAEGKEIAFSYNSGLVGLGSQVQIDPSAFLGKNGLQDDEAEIVREIISNIYLVMGYENTTRTKLIETNQEINYVRNRMMLFFAKKSIIQSMDVVNVFMTTKTMEDTGLTQGFPGFQSSGGLRTGQVINNLLKNINSSLNDFSGSKTSFADLDRLATVGPDFPPWLWRMFKNDFTKMGAGTAIFVGLVKHVKQAYAGGKHTVQVSCEDNANYFNKSQISFKPSVDVFNGALYDPLTPFNVSFDAATGVAINDVQDGAMPPLLPENERLLQTRAIRFKSTDFRGQSANQVLYKTKKGEIVFGKIRKVLADTDGFVFRWKQGIQSLTKVESASPADSAQSETSQRLTANPFAGQDVMNVLSLLITGQPYNFNAFIKAALANANDVVAFDPTTNQDSHSSYIDGVVRQLSKQNTVWGNFVPFKSLSVNEAAYSFLAKGQADLTTRQSRINGLLRERAALIDKRSLMSAGQVADFNSLTADTAVSAGSFGINDMIINGIDKQISLLDLKIGDVQDGFNDEVTKLYKENSGNISIIGDDITLNPGFSDDDGGTATDEGDRQLSRAAMRSRINAMALRRLWKVKANSDTNLFIVDDQYDKNFDIQAFERKIDSSLKLFDSEYMTVESQIKTTAQLLGLEIFADSQGNIRVRPPAYNKMPSSVFYKMFKDRNETGVKVFPDFLESLLFNQTKALTDMIEITEDQIRLRAMALGISGDSANEMDGNIRVFIQGKSEFSGQAGFSFLTDPTTGRIPGEKMQNVPTQATSDALEGQDNISLAQLTGLNEAARKQANLFKAFDINTRVNQTQKNKFSEQASSAIDKDSKTLLIRKRLQANHNIKAPTPQELFSDKRFSNINNAVSELDAMNVLKQLAQFVSARQKYVKELANVSKNLIEGLTINNEDNGGQSALTPFLNRKTAIPSLLEHMLEDETLHDLGEGSGNRFVISDSRIISLEISENPPKYTAVQVNGLFAEGLTNSITALGANMSGTSDGNLVTSAYAVDYDMWRQYGFKVPNSVAAPFFSDPVSQCAPYAVALLNLARKNIINGNLQVSGYNEFYQAGDVVYIESYDLLFYVTSVSHSFSYGGNVTTSLNLTYGHSPGEYIPTQLDIVGKFFYNAQTFSEQFRSARFDVEGSDNPLGAIIVQNSAELGAVLAGPNGKQNQGILNKMLYGASGMLNALSFSGVKPRLQIRVYVDKKHPTGSAMLNSAAQQIRNFLVNPEQYSTLTDKIIGQPMNGNFTLTFDDIYIEYADIDEGVLSPSSAAWNSVRLIEGSGSAAAIAADANTRIIGGVQDSGNLDAILMSSILDVWVTYETIVKSVSFSGATDQAAINQNAGAAASMAAADAQNAADARAAEAGQASGEAASLAGSL